MGISCFSGLVALTLGSREASTVPVGLITGVCDPHPHPALGPPLLTTMEARMGTWMIHFLFPELKSQHLGEVEASAPPLLFPPGAAHGEAPELVYSEISCGGHRAGEYRVWPGMRPPSESSFQVASCDIEGGTELD